MSTETIGFISGLLVIVSIIPYAIRTYEGKIHPNLTSWSLWTLIGLALLLTYKSSGAGANVWPAMFGFTNPLLITLLVLKKHGRWKRMNRIEIFCLVLGLISLGIWVAVHDRPELAQFALYLAIGADAFAAIPTFHFVWTQPHGDRPFAWCFFAVGYGLAIFAITEHTFSNYVLPLWMFFGALGVSLPLILYRWKKKLPLSEWI